VANRSQIDLLITALVLVRKASSAIDTALGLPAADRVQLEDSLDAVRHDLGRLVSQLGNAVPGASAIGRRPEFKAAAGVVEFVARQGAAQLGAVASVADTLRQGEDSRALAQRIERHLADVGVASRAELAEALAVEPDSARLREALERALGTGRAEWYAPDVYGVPRSRLEDLAGEAPPTPSEADSEAAAQPADAAEGEAGTGDDRPGGLDRAVDELEGSLAGLGAAMQEIRTGASRRPAVGTPQTRRPARGD
jgi:hypothetical protein